MDAFLVGAVRTPVGRRGGALAAVHPADLAGHTLAALMERTGVDPAVVDDVVLGCVDTLGPQSGDIARTAWLAAGLPEHVPGVTVDRQCGSGQQAVHFAAQAVLSGTADLVVAGGVQSMSQVPIGSAMADPDPGRSARPDQRSGRAWPAGRAERSGPARSVGPYRGSAGWVARYGEQELSQFRSADEIAAKWSLTRPQLEDWSLRSHLRAIEAVDDGRFAGEIAPYAGHRTDECPRRDTSAARMAALAPLRDGGLTTAAMASQLSDGAAALLIANDRAVREHGLRPRARVHHLCARGDDPVLMLTAPIAATAHALRRSGLSIHDIDRFEVNEAFASVVLAWLRETGADPERVNVNGGAIALGHPLGATGARLMVGLLHELERIGGRYGLLTMCEGGGQANVTIIERLG